MYDEYQFTVKNVLDSNTNQIYSQIVFNFYSGSQIIKCITDGLEAVEKIKIPQIG